MTLMWKVTTQWSGFAGAPGYTNLYLAANVGGTTSAQNAVDRVRALWEDIVSEMAEPTTYQLPSGVEVIDSDTGLLQDVIGVTAGAQGTFGGTGIYAAAAGAVLSWRTSSVRFGHRVRGRTFVVPLAGSSYDADGTLRPLTVTRLASAAANYVSGTVFPGVPVIYTRPSPSHPVGGAYQVQSGGCRDRVAILRSRR